MFLLVLYSPRSYKESRKWHNARQSVTSVVSAPVTMFSPGAGDPALLLPVVSNAWLHLDTWSSGSRNVGNVGNCIIVILRMCCDNISDIITANDIIVSTRGWSGVCWHVEIVSWHPAALLLHLSAVHLSSDAHPLMIFLQQKFNLTRAKICISTGYQMEMLMHKLTVKYQSVSFTTHLGF